MDLYFDPAQAAGYKSRAQIVRVLSEHWLKANIPCINCGGALEKTANNSYVKDFTCPHRVRQQWLANRYLHGMGRQKTWLIATLRCLEQLPQTFTLADLYRFVPQLARTYPANHNIEAKLRQQLQTLRDQGKITFLTRDHYRQNP